VLCSVARGVMMVAKLVCDVLFLYEFVVNRHSLDFIVGRRKPFPQAFVSQCFGYSCKCPHSCYQACGLRGCLVSRKWVFQLASLGKWHLAFTLSSAAPITCVGELLGPLPEFVM
jgi:hypothetical protein